MTTAATASRNLTSVQWADRLQAGTVALSEFHEELLAVLVQHRLMTTRQLRILLTPHRTRQHMSHHLARLAAAQLIASTPVQGTRNDKAWWTTTSGRARIAHAVRQRPYVMNAERAHSNLQRHTLLTNQIGVEFVRWSREAGHECGPLDWDNEVGHRVRDGEVEANTMVVSDLRVRLMLQDRRGSAALVRLIEADRGTESIHALVDKVRNYTRMFTFIPAHAARSNDTVPQWRRNYSAFPKVVIVFADRDPEWMRRRARSLMDLCRGDVLIGQYLAEIGLMCTTFDQLTTSGPFAPIFWNHAGVTVDIRDNPQAATADTAAGQRS